MKGENDDPANGYDALAGEFMRRRAPSPIGVATVGAWAATLPPGCTVLDLGCGSGVPISQTLADKGLHVHGVDASPALCAAFAGRFPDAPVECAPAEDATFLNRQYDAVIAWGLLFLLAPETQERVIQRAAAALAPGGTFLFTAPAPACEWIDVLTGRKSTSLGADAYGRLIAEAGLLLENEMDDEGQNHYYLARKPARAERVG